jgi:hypothetical protein
MRVVAPLSKFGAGNAVVDIGTTHRSVPGQIGFDTFQ